MKHNHAWMALNLEMPPVVPHTEYSVGHHWNLLNTLFGTRLSENSPADEKDAAWKALVRRWNIDLIWATHIGYEIFGDVYTEMGHAEYEAGGIDWKEPKPSPFNDPEDVLSFDPWETFGERDHTELVRYFEDSYQKMRAEYPDAVNMTGVYVTMISGLLGIFGWENLLLAAGTDPKRFGALANRYASWIQQYYNAMGDADVPVIMVHDDIVWSSGPFIAPRWYREFIFPNYQKLFAPLIDSGKKILYTSDGNYTQFIDDIADCGVNCFVMEPMTDMDYIAQRYGRTHSFIGNADVRILMRNRKEEIWAEVERCMSIGKSCPGFIMAVGNHIPANTPVEAVLTYWEAYEAFSKR